MITLPARSAPRSKPVSIENSYCCRGARPRLTCGGHNSNQGKHRQQLSITSEADVTDATEFRSRRTREFDFSYTDLMIYAVARALMRHPRMNARLDGAEITIAASANVGIAVALEEGLIVPVLRSAERKSLRDIALESRTLGEKARGGHLKLEDVSGGTFTGRYS
jgi:pyruvate dehydrogenase E2 component (dihydrolipoamide acetyltransferase)